LAIFSSKKMFKTFWSCIHLTSPTTLFSFRYFRITTHTTSI